MLKIERVSMALPNGVLRLPDLTVDKGQLLVLTGTSGIGKSSVLHWLLGEQLSHITCYGQCWLNDNEVTRQPIERRRIGLMMQDVHLFPHLNVTDNIAFALPPDVKGKSTRRRRAVEHLHSIDMMALAQRYPEELSGGERSRIGLVRALANQPQAMLLDEPFSALDATTRGSIRRWSYEQLKQANIPAVVVTHDPDDIAEGAEHLDLNPHFKTKLCHD